MSIDYGEKERQFLETLKADTGRALDDWMAAITAEGLANRNEIIDWLRRQGFMFSKASWLERIHNNGGKPIYADAGRARPRARPRAAAPSVSRPVTPAEAPPPSRDPVPSVAPVPPREPPAVVPIASPIRAVESDPAAIDALLARAKAFRPLAVYLVAEVRKVAPGAVVVARDSHLIFRMQDTEFALLAVNAKELRLGLALKGAAAGVPLEAAKFALRGAPSMSHMIVLTDARQITPALLAAIAQAAAGT